MLRRTSVSVFACAGMLITFGCLLFVRALYTVCVRPSWQPPARMKRSPLSLSLSPVPNPPEGRRIREREQTSESSADESEAMLHGPLGIYYNQ